MLIAHLTDPHVGLAPTGTKCPPLDPTGALRRALAHVRGLRPAVDVVLLSGDLVDGGQEADYQVVLELLQQELPAHAAGGPRVLAIPGNHDRRATARRVLGDFMPVAPNAPADLCCLHVRHDGLNLIGLDSVVPGQPHGGLDAAQLDWLARTLQACAGQPALIFMHHPPLVSGLAIMDRDGLRQGRAELEQLVAQHGGVQLVAAGHVHRPIAGVLGGAPVVVAPSTSHQLNLDLRPDGPLAVRLEPPMIGLYRWTPEDGIACHFNHVQEFDGPYPC